MKTRSQIQPFDASHETIEEFYNAGQRVRIVKALENVVVDGEGQDGSGDDGFFLATEKTVGNFPYGRLGNILWVRTSENMLIADSRFTLVVVQVGVRHGPGKNEFLSEGTVSADDWCLVTDCAIHRMNVSRYLAQAKFVRRMAQIPPPPKPVQPITQLRATWDWLRRRPAERK